MMDEYDSRLMERALGAARSAMQNGENPIGCVLAVDGKVVAIGETRVARGGPTCHGENSMIECLGHRIWSVASNAVLYSTLEPCLMCIGACINAGITKMYYGMDAVDGGGYALGAINAGLTNKLIVHGPTAHDQVVKLFQEYLTISRNEGGIQYARSLLAFHDTKEG